MTTSNIIDGMIAKQNEIGFTNQQWSDASGVPKTTIDRIKRKETINPSMQTILDMANAVGYTINSHPEQIPAVPQEIGIKDPMVQHLINVYENRGRSYEERIKRNSAHYNQLLAEKNRWIKFSLTLNIILVVFICLILVYDVLHPDVGWIREQLAKYTGNRFEDAVISMKQWFSSFRM